MGRIAETPVSTNSFWDQDRLHRIRYYQPGDTLDQRPNIQFPQRIVCPIIGLVGQGKSALVDTLRHILGGFATEDFHSSDYSTTVVASETHLTDHITVIDTPGCRPQDLDLWSQMDSTTALSVLLNRCLLGMEITNQSFSIHCPIFVHSLDDIQMVNQLKPYAQAFSQATGVQPIVFITNFDRLTEVRLQQASDSRMLRILETEESLIRWVVGQLGCGYVYHISNYTRGSVDNPRQNVQFLNHLTIICAISDTMIAHNQAGLVTFTPDSSQRLSPRTPS